MKTLLMTTVAALFVAGTAYAAEEDIVVLIDADADGSVTVEEWNEYGSGIFGEWDADADGMLSEDEYNTGMWNMYDADRDGTMSMDEMSMLSGAFRSGAEVSQ